MPRGKSANGASKGVGGSREFSGADCRRVAAVIRATLVAVDGCCCCWGGGWTCGHSGLQGHVSHGPLAHGVWPNCAISQFLLFCSVFLAALLENVLPRCQGRAKRMFVSTSTAVCARTVSSTAVFPSQQRLGRPHVCWECSIPQPGQLEERFSRVSSILLNI